MQMCPKCLKKAREVRVMQVSLQSTALPWAQRARGGYCSASAFQAIFRKQTRQCVSADQLMWQMCTDMCIHCGVNPSFNLRCGSGFLTPPATQLKTTQKKKNWDEDRACWVPFFTVLLSIPSKYHTYNSCYSPEVLSLLPNPKRFPIQGGNWETTLQEQGLFVPVSGFSPF